MAFTMRASVSKRTLVDAAGFPDASDWTTVGNKLRQNIQWRTRLGNDANGAAFEPYSEGYLKTRQKKNWSTGRVTLKTGAAGHHMMDDITFTVQVATNPRVTLYFATAPKAQIAQYHMGEGRVDREFFALSNDDLDAAVDIIRARMQRRTGGGL